MNKQQTSFKVIISLTLLFLLIFQTYLIFGLTNTSYNSSQVPNSIDYPKIINSSRAEIVSSDGMILASSSKTFVIVADNTKLTDEVLIESITNLAKLVTESSDTVTLQEFLFKYNSTTQNGEIKRNDIEIGSISEGKLGLVKNTTLNLDGITLKSKISRTYSDPTTFSQVLGYLSSTNSTGLEQTYSKILTNPKVKNLELNIDYSLQKNIENLFKTELADKSTTTASLIVLDLNSNKITSLLSYPKFSLENITSNADYYNSVSKDPTKPLLDKAISETYPTGSIMKIVTGLSLLETGTINKNSTYYSEGIYMLPGNIPFPEYYKVPYGNLNIVNALRRSSNIFFCKAIQNMNYNDFTKYQKLVGLGSPTGIDLPNEVSGIIPTPEYKISTFGENWFVGDSCNAVIGQGYTSLTPIQMVTALSSILTNKKCEPRVANLVEYFDGTKEQVPQSCEDLHFNNDNVATLKQGMREVAKSAGLQKYDVAIKTGTAEAGDSTVLPHAWVMGFYPYEEPKYAFVFMVEHGEKTSIVIDVLKQILDRKLLDN